MGIVYIAWIDKFKNQILNQTGEWICSAARIRLSIVALIPWLFITNSLIKIRWQSKFLSKLCLSSKTKPIKSIRIGTELKFFPETMPSFLSNSNKAKPTLSMYSFLTLTKLSPTNKIRKRLNGHVSLIL